MLGTYRKCEAPVQESSASNQPVPDANAGGPKTIQQPAHRFTHPAEVVPVMQDTQLTRISNFIWSVTDDVLRDVFVRGKYRDVILPMTVLRRLDAVLEPTKQKVLEEKKWLDDAAVIDQAPILQEAAGQAFYNTSPFTLRDLRPSIPADTQGRFRGIPRRILTQRPRHPQKVRVPQPTQPLSRAASRCTNLAKRRKTYRPAICSPWKG